MLKRVWIFATLINLSVSLASCAKDPVSEQPVESNISNIISEESSATPEAIKEPSPTDEATLAADPVPSELGTWEYFESLPRLYQKHYEKSPHVAYSADEWMDDDGRLDFPFDLHEDTSNMQQSEAFARYYIPDDALKKSTTDNLLELITLWSSATYYLYDYHSYYLMYLLTGFNATDELITRSDLAEVVLHTYTEDEFMPEIDFDDSQEQMAYNKERTMRENRIVLYEILLATDEVFDLMDDEMKQQTLSAVIDKMEIRDSGEYPYLDLGTRSGFFAYVTEPHNISGSSKWYDYIVEILDDDMIKNLVNDELNMYWH